MIKSETGVEFPVLLGQMDVKRMTKCIDLLAHGLYYHEYNKVFNGECLVIFGFVNYPEEGMNQQKLLVEAMFKAESDKYEKKGNNPKIFYYQLVPPDEQGIIALKLTFFEGTHFYVALKDKNVIPKFNLIEELFNAGFPITFTVEDGKQITIQKNDQTN